MRATGSTISLTLHVAVVAAALLGTATAGPRELSRPTQPLVWLPPERDERVPVPSLPGLDGGVVVPTIPSPTIPTTLDVVGSPTRTLLPLVGAPRVVGDGGPAAGALFSDEAPLVLSGPLPAYPELLRQAGIQGRVVLEAVVDTTGKVVASSIQVVHATNPAFVEGARRALRATLFRPGRVAGRAVAVRVRLPFEFTIRNGAGFGR